MLATTIMPTTRSKTAKAGSAPGDVDARAQARRAGKANTPRKNAKADIYAAAAGAAADDTDAHQDVTDKSSKPGSKRKHAEPDTGQPKAASDKDGDVEQDKWSLPDNAVEQGKVSFMFKPKVTEPGSAVAVSSLDDVQRLYILMEPQQPAGGKVRLLVVAKKRLPDTKRHERFFAFVEAVGSSPGELTQGLQEHTYTTKTRGERLQPAAQPAGEGTYVIAKGGRNNGIHLGFKLLQPPGPGDVQDMLGIKGQGSFVLSAKVKGGGVQNPDKKGQGPNVPSAGPEPAYSDEQREEFQGRSWIGVEDRSLLDVAGTELLLVGAKEQPIETGELGDAGKLLESTST